MRGGGGGGSFYPGGHSTLPTDKRTGVVSCRDCGDIYIRQTGNTR